MRGNERQGCVCSLRYRAQLGRRQQRWRSSFLPGIRPPALPSVASHPRQCPATAQRPSQHWRQESASHGSLQSVGVPVNSSFIHSLVSGKPLSVVYRVFCLVCQVHFLRASPLSKLPQSPPEDQCAPRGLRACRGRQRCQRAQS